MSTPTNYGYILSSPFDLEEDMIQLELEFPLVKDKYMYIKINKHCDIREIRHFLKDHGYSDVKIYYNQKELKSGSFVENNINNNAGITIHPIFSAGIFNTTQSVSNRDIIMFEVDKKIFENILDEINHLQEYNEPDLTDIDKINKKYDTFMEEEIQREKDLIKEKESMKNKLLQIKKMRELAKTNKNKSTIKNNKEELLKKAQKIIKEEQLKEKMKEKNNFCGFKKGFLVKSQNN